MFGTRLSLIASTIAATAGGAIVDDSTLIPMGIVVAAVAATGTITWKVAKAHHKMQSTIEKQQEHINSLERLYGSRHKTRITQDT